jgi:hypothetical protein
MTTLRRIEEVRRLPSTVSNGPMILTLEGGEKMQCPENHIGGIVPVVGDFIEDGHRIFQHYRVVKTSNNPSLRLSDGNPLPSPHPRDVAAKEGDYYIRRTDGYRLVERYRFERENASALEALRAREQRAVGA